MPALVALFTLLLILLSKGDAHPVAQGAMDIAITEKTVRITARVANEQAFVEAAFGAGGEMPSDHAEIWKHHGEYLLQHVRVQADEATLPGTVVGFRAPDNSAATARITYELEFTIPPGATPPRAVTFTQDVLNEFEFVPGNRWEATYVVRIGQSNRPAQEGLLFTSTEPLIFACDWSATQPEEKASQLGKSALFGAYFHHGMMHILTGYDHLLFMAALVLAAATLWDLVKVVTAFTLAHTITLALSVFDIVRLPSHIVEPVIAGSIVFVGLQNVFWPKHTRGWGRLLIAFAFGLFHGLGFAGGLLEAMEGLPAVAVVLAITAFSLGVEIGHQAVVLPVFGLVKLARAAATQPTARDRVVLGIQRWGSGAIAAAGMFYLVLAMR